MVMRHGWNATCYQTVNAAFEYSFFPELDGMVAFVRSRGKRVVASAPVCPPENLPEVIRRFEAQERSSALYFGAGERVREALGALKGSRVVSLGAQPVWNPQTWESRVMAHASLRYQFRRAATKGVVIREWTTEEAQDSPGLRGVLAEWLSHRDWPPMHFLIEPETLDDLRDRRTFVAEFRGEPVAFLNLCPVPTRNGWLTEQFPRRQIAPNGTVELLMHEAAKTIAAEGASYLTMGLVPLSVHGQLENNPRWLRLMMRSTSMFQGLDMFKSKFDPERWEPVYAAAPSRRFLPDDLFTIATAFSGRPLSHLLGAKLVGGIAALLSP